MSGLDQTQIANLLAADSAKKSSGGTRAPKDTTEPRDFGNWFKQMHTHGTCSNPKCVDPREGGGPEGTAMIAVINGLDTCRFCFLAGYARTVAN